jgi:uncharacterized protein YkwD
MSRVRTAALLAVLVSVLALPGAASASSATQKMIQRVNAVRAHYGLRALHASRSLAGSARRYSSYLMHAGYFGHANRIHASRHFRTLGEILEIHGGKRAAVGATLRDWMHSPEHRSIILSPAFSFAGAGFVEGRWRGQRATIWVMHFGHR